MRDPIKKLWERDKGICCICDWPCALEDATREHVIPKSQGGAKGVVNIRLAHYFCNHQNGNGVTFALRCDAWLRVARSITIGGRDRTWYAPIPADIFTEAQRLTERGFRRQRRVPRSLAIVKRSKK